MYAMKCDRCGNYFDSNTLRLKSGELFGHINVRGEDNHCCKYDLCDDCVVDFFRWVNDPGKLKGGDAGGQENAETVQGATAGTGPE